MHDLLILALDIFCLVANGFNMVRSRSLL